jgi:hypothetical protein
VFDKTARMMDIDVVMPEVLARLLLVATVVLAGVGTCPRRAPACDQSLRAAHQCCAPALRAGTCCCRGAHGDAPLLATPAQTHQDRHATKILTSAALHPIVPPVSSALRSTGDAREDPGLSPPDTLINQHTSLLL